MTSRQPSVWSRARQLAERTPESRNRSVDLLRAASISVVVIGHWLMAAPWVEDGRLQLGDMLHLAPWTQWLTWAFQVMPLFFIVGGFANAASWDAARRAGQGYGQWTAARLRRLVGPVVPLLIVWSLLAAIAHRFGVHPRMMALGTFHGGLVLALQAPLRRWLQQPRPWALTILVNASIMTVYLWHVTVMALVVGLASLLGGIGLGLEPGTAAWWLSRPLWLVVLAAGLALLVPVFGRFEQEARGGAARPLPGWRALAGAAAVCAGLGLLALGGIGDTSALGVRIGPVLLALAGAALVLGSPSRRWGGPAAPTPARPGAR